MKRFVLIIIVLLTTLECVSSCKTVTSESQIVNDSKYTVEESEALNTNGSTGVKWVNRSLRNIPEEFRNVDFGNFEYTIPGTRKTFKLIDGEYESDYDSKNCDNRMAALMKDDYADVNGDGQREAFVATSYTYCGCGSCDGGSVTLRLFKAGGTQPKLIWSYSTGSAAYSGGLRSAKLESNMLEVEEFVARKCSAAELMSNPACGGKFEGKNIIRRKFQFIGNTFKQVDTEVMETEPYSTNGEGPEIIVIP